MVFQEKGWRDDIRFNNVVSVRLNVSCAQCVTGAEIYPDAGICLYYDIGVSSQGFEDNVSCFRHLTINIIFCLYIAQNYFRSEKC